MTRFADAPQSEIVSRCAYPVSFDVASTDMHEVNYEVIEELLRRGTVRNGDLVIITKGDRSGVEGQTNIMKIMRVGEHRLLNED
ncbi:pyruvate kinase alpha/beta domain-containing protein [Chromatium okenii]|uniref:pyruvate kinase alpha/beta domain-containing protein n=1 Tax=Chromatium okenii TaxID=61644 RepID=UPI001F5BAF60